MVEFQIKINPKQRLAYIPKEVFEAFGPRLKMKTDRYAAIIFPENLDRELLIRSLTLLLEDLKLENLKVQNTPVG
ncbi:MAG: hypothetical protein QW707_06050 [Candidatus Bathyarchaeia archaeon]